MAENKSEGIDDTQKLLRLLEAVRFVGKSYAN